MTQLTVTTTFCLQSRSSSNHCVIVSTFCHVSANIIYIKTRLWNIVCFSLMSPFTIILSGVAFRIWFYKCTSVAFFRAMIRRAQYCYMASRLSVSLSMITLMDRTGWNSSKIRVISRLVSLGCSLAANPDVNSVYSSLSTENNCLHTPYRSKFTVASRGFPAIVRLLDKIIVIVNLAILLGGRARVSANYHDVCYWQRSAWL